MKALPSGVSFHLLGGIEARRDGGSLPIGGPRQRALLALLLVHARRAVSVDLLVDELWAGEPPDRADTTLRSYVSRLRAALGEEVAIVHLPGGYVIDVPDAAIDARRFETLFREGQAAALTRASRRARERLGAALDLWGGPPFADLAGDGMLRVEAERLEALRLTALELRIEVDLELGRHDAVVQELEGLVREHPFRERLWAQLMLALYRAGRQADALAAYQRARDELEEHLGLDPGDELERLQGQILRHEVPVPTSAEARHNLPAPLTSFIGRTEELANIARLMEASRLVTLVGVGGVGKTRLALEAARARVADQPDGVTFVDLAPLADAQLLPGHIAAALDVREQAGVAGVGRLTGHLRDLDALILLDNCEHLRAAVAHIAAELLQACPGLRLLATSRETLGAPGEVEFPVQPLGALGGARGSGTARDSDAVRLFLARAREARPDIPDDDRTIETIAGIVADLDGLPLGIELAAARARALSPAEIATRIRDRFRFLVSWRRLAAARHRTLREAMDWSYGLLEPEEQQLLRGLSVFAGGCTFAAVAAICADDDEDAALVRLERLVEASLVTVDGSTAPTRYRVLETVRQYGADKLEAAGERAVLRRRHAGHFTAVAEAAWDALRTGGVWVQSDWTSQLAQDRDNFRMAAAWHQETGDFDAMLRIAESLWWFCWIRGDLSEGRAWLETALERSGSTDVKLRARGYLGAAGLAWAQGDYDAAERRASTALTLFAQVGSLLEQGSALNTLGLIADGRHDFARAKTLFEDALDRFRAVREDDRTLVGRNIAVTVDNLGSVSHELGEEDAALAYYREALDLNRARQDLEGVAMNELHIAIIVGEAGQLDEARTLLASALRVYATLGFGQYAAECLEAASIVANGTNASDAAAFLLGAAARLRDDAGAPPVPFMARLRERETTAALTALGEERFGALHDEGRHTSLEVAVERGLAFLA